MQLIWSSVTISKYEDLYTILIHCSYYPILFFINGNQYIKSCLQGPKITVRFFINTTCNNKYIRIAYYVLKLDVIIGLPKGLKL